MGEKTEKQRDIKDSAGMAKSMEDRNHIIIKTSILGILANIFLALFKAVIGIFTHSIAIILDAVNNLSDAGSSLITIVGTKLAGRAPDKKHPFGYGRVEYLSAMVISLIVLYAGFTSFEESVKKIIHPDTPDYKVVALLIVAAGVLVKILLGRYVKNVGEKVNSDSLINSGEDATLDSIISASTLVAAGLYLWKGWSLEAWLGALISLVIIKSGIDMLKETLSKVLGERVDVSLAKEITDTVLAFEGVNGAYDLILNNYGPESYNGSIHIEVPDTYSAGDLDRLSRNIMVEVYKKHGVALTAIGIYSTTSNSLSHRVKREVEKLAMSKEHVLQIHGFYLNEPNKSLRFDIVISLEAEDRQAIYESFYKDVKKMYPDYSLELGFDTDFSEV